MCDFIGTYSKLRMHSRSEHSFQLYETRLEKEKGEECSTFSELGEESSEESTFSIGHSALTSSLVDLCMPGNSEESNNTFILSSDGMIPHWSLLPQLDYLGFLLLGRATIFHQTVTPVLGHYRMVLIIDPSSSSRQCLSNYHGVFLASSIGLSENAPLMAIVYATGWR